MKRREGASEASAEKPNRSDSENLNLMMKSGFFKIAVPVTIGVAAFLIFNSCSVSIPKGAKAIKDFDAEKYLGTWYEIARFDYRFEKNLDNVTATYSQKPDGSLKVDNKGFDYVKKQWRESIGEARFVNGFDEARLKVSFFRPFWSGYNVIDIDADYRYALVVGNNLDYIWFLSREKTMPENVKDRFVSKAKALGYDTSALIWVHHD